MALAHKREDVAVGFVHSHATAHEARADHDFRPPGRATILAAPRRHTVPDRQHRAILGDDHVGKTIAGKDLLLLKSCLAEEWFEVAFRGGLRSERCSEYGQKAKQDVWGGSHDHEAAVVECSKDALMSFNEGDD